MIEIIRKYWSIYGGFSALFKSGYFWWAICITGILFPAWLHAGWWNDVLSLLPNLLGFSLGGFAILLAVGDDGFKKLIAGSENSESSPYMDACTAFVHFIFLQIIAILLSLIAKNYYSVIPACIPKEILILLSAIGYFFFIYSIFCAMAAVFAVFRVADWFDAYISKINKKDDNDEG
ncbi:hypothetical protein [Providencia manganoxydans]|uniref:hypothetical protein n=1 Tax=Providencia manganoxydans TaxID=2923283 RepID=UPI0029C0BD5F|nr:hypothetical protein [Providencia manganoxydans]MDX4947173.1 hypothetical protein [Providencia manganoxydans]